MKPAPSAVPGEAIVVAEHLYKVFGDAPARALELLERGFDRDRIFRETGQTVAVEDASLEIRAGEIFVLMGLSGSGKSTLLRLINRLIEPSHGRVLIGGRDVTRMSPTELIELRRHELAMVFQSFALMPHLRVWENVAFGLEIAGVPRRQRRDRAHEALELVGLRANADSYPDELSGGMRQRVGLARALAATPKILLMDEAFSALDPLIRASMQDELMALQRKRGLTVLFVSHDLDEAMRIGDRIAIMRDGRILQVGTGEQILRAPADDYVRSFFGGVDLTRVFSAGDLAVAESAVLTAGDLEPSAALEALRRDGRELSCVCAEDGRYLGMVSVDSLARVRAPGSRSLEEAYLDGAPLPADAPLEAVVSRLASSHHPLPVVDDAGRLLGTISQTRLLEILASRGR